MATLDTSSQEFKDAVKAAVDEATAGLVAKRDELLTEVKTLRKGKAIDPADLEKLETEIDSLKGELTKAQKVAQKATKEAETATKALESEQGAVRNLLVENGLTDALTKSGVTNPAHLKAAKALLASGVKLEQDGDSRIAKIGDKSLADAIKEWAGGDEGKHFVAAPINGGGGASGSKGGATSKTMSREQFQAADPATRSEFSKSGGTLTD
jgi:hypothetical protein